MELGRRLGLYTAVHSHGQTTPAQLAARTGIAQRYAKEWLEQQAAAGILDVDGDHFTLPAAHIPVLLVDTDPAHLMGAAPMLAALALTLPAVAAAYRSGGGVPYEEFGTELRHGIAAFNRPAFTHDLAGWLETMPDVASRLSAGGRVLDLGCGTGWSSIAIAQAFPAARVHGLDTDTASIDEARHHAAQAGVADRVTFTTANAADVPTDEPYDLVVRVRGAARHGRTGPGAPRGPGGARPGRPGPHRRRTGQRDVHRTGRRGRADDVQLLRPALPSRHHGRIHRGRQRHHAPARHRPRLGAPGRLPDRRRAAHREPLLALLPPGHRPRHPKAPGNPPRPR